MKRDLSDVRVEEGDAAVREVLAQATPRARTPRSLARRAPHASRPSVMLASEPEWMHGLTRKGNGQLESVAGNAELYLRHHSAWAGTLGFDEMAYRPTWIRTPPVLPGFTPPPAPMALKEGDFVFVQQWLCREVGVSFRADTIETAMRRAAEANRFHPVRDYLDALRWDGVLRLSTWLQDYMGVEAPRDAPAAEYLSAVGAATLIAAVARAYSPGAKVDTMLILEGDQGFQKSQALRALIPNQAWFSDHLPDLRDKDAMLHLQGLWFVEVAELDALRGTENSRIKAFLSKQHDRFRPPFARHEVAIPRGCIFIGTTNGGHYLNDGTGGRRFWPVRVERHTDLGGLQRDRDQLWAEAVERYRAGAIWYLDASVEAIARDEQEARFLPHPWEDTLRERTRDLSTVTIREALEWLGCSLATLKGTEAKTIAGIMRRLGFKDARLGTDPNRYRGFKRSSTR